MLLYYITDRTQFSGNEQQRRERLLEKIAEAARAGIDYLQLREKDLSGRELESLARSAVQQIRANGGKTRVLVNSRTDVALAAGADGVHLRSKDISPQDVRNIWRKAHASQDPIIAVSCHTHQDVTAADNAGADFVVFGPVFEKKGSRQVAPALVPLNSDVPKSGLLHSGSRNRTPVLALGGITVENAPLCVGAGASGIAGIRLFQEADISEVVAKLRSY